ncbi:hypothetical protein RP20_CCG026555 [Aedes albopictus]|nr:uncharacterized protein LOC115267725 [Aedes albopictus]KXJ69572.1 hypothetical protein RP20_CCG026555 [Aedes albopictus]
MSSRKQNKVSAAALMQAIQQQNSMEREMKHVSTQTEPDESATGNDDVNTKLNKCMRLLSHVNAKVDTIGASISALQSTSTGQCQHPKGTPNVTLATISMQPVKSLADLEQLEESCRSEDFVKRIVASIGRIHGHHRYTGNGATVSLQIIDYFFSRDFMLKCSWTGISRASDTETKTNKIPFMKFDKTIDLFYQTVLYSDPIYAFSECKDFLHRCLKNAKQRFAEVTGTRKPVSRKRKRMMEAENRSEDQRSEEAVENASDAELAGEQLANDEPPEAVGESASWQIEFLEGEEEIFKAEPTKVDEELLND